MTRFPIGTDAEDAAAMSGLPGAWITVNPFDNYYSIYGTTGGTRHTGEDFELHDASGTNISAGAPVYATDDGTVLFSGIGGGITWVWIIVIKHIAPDGTAYTARYAHVDHTTFTVPKKGDSVKRGQQIARLGNGDGYYGSAYHLHFDVCVTDLLEKHPNEWPGLDNATLLANYVDPIKFIIARKKAEKSMNLFNGTLQPYTRLISAFTLQSDGSMTWSGAYDGGSGVVFDADPASAVTWQGLEFVRTTDGRYVYAKDVIQGSAYVPPAPPVQPPTVVTVKKYVTATSGLHVRTATNFSASSLVIDPQTNQPILLFPPTYVNVVSTPATANGATWYQIDPTQAPMGGYFVDGDYLSDTAPVPNP